MDKNAIKKYAVWARRELIEKVSQKALQYGIEDGKEFDPSLESINGVLLSENEKKQRQALIRKITEDGYGQVMEEVAYTWFNRFIALRFMEVNGYLPSHIRVFSDDNNSFRPQIMAEALYIEFENIDKDRIIEYKQHNCDEELYRYLLIAQCNELSKLLPGIFNKINDYTELLLPDYLLRSGSVIAELVESIPVNYFDVNSEVGQVEIIGWLYQYYNTEQNELVYDGTLSKSRIPKELLSAATTIYTPDWAVKYMVENSLGRLWMDHNSSSSLKDKWKYFLPQDKYSSDTNFELEKLKCIDPCAGSGHICCYLFDVLMDLYEESGYGSKDAARLIVENNIWALDVEDRAAQLAYFSLMMKGCRYDRRFIQKGIVSHVYSIKESNYVDNNTINHIKESNISQKEAIIEIIDMLKDAKEYGSILRSKSYDFSGIYADIESLVEENTIFSVAIENEIIPLINCAEVLCQKYDVVVTNPPYLGSNRFSPKLTNYVTKYYKDEKSDLSMVMYKKALSEFTKKGGYVSFITTSSWMSLSSFQKLREYVLSSFDLTSLVDFGTELFEGKVGHNPIVAWTVRNTNSNSRFIAVRLTEYCLSRRDEKEPEFFNESNYYRPLQSDISAFPGCAVSSYWADEELIHAFANYDSLTDIAKPCVGLQTGENDKFVRLWFECDIDRICFDAHDRNSALASKKRWFPYNKGGEYRKWYGNNDYIVNWENDGQEIRTFTNDKGKLKSRPQNIDYYFKECISWSKISSGNIAFRYKPFGHVFDVAGTSIFVKKEWRNYILAFCNSTVALKIASILSPTLNYEVGHIASFPIIIDESVIDEVNSLVDMNIQICKDDWDSYETSWDFKKSPLLKGKGRLSDIYSEWKEETNNRFADLKRNEERVNEIFAQIYNLTGKVQCEVDDKSVSVSRADYSKDMKNLISYAVGCIFGRYSLDDEGIICAGSVINFDDYTSFIPDKDGIVPICDDEYFEDDIVSLFEKFLSVSFGKDYIDENLEFVANGLGKKGSARETIRQYFLNDFFVDHCAVYSGNVGRRPIYWLFDSGKKNGFKCLIYMHRYQPDTIARIRTDYVHEQQARYRTAVEETEKRIESAAGSDKVKLTKKLNTLKAQDDEIHAYEEKIHHLADQMISIDLDDGVKHNYEIFKDVLAKIK